MGLLSSPWAARVFTPARPRRRLHLYERPLHRSHLARARAALAICYPAPLRP